MVDAGVFLPLYIRYTVLTRNSFPLAPRDYLDVYCGTASVQQWQAF
jgi:hypothetical protein